MRYARPQVVPKWPRGQRMVGLAGRSWMLPRAKKFARANRKVEGRRKFTNGTAGQTQVFLRANPVGSIRFRELLVRTAKAWPVRKNRGPSAELALQKGFPQERP